MEFTQVEAGELAAATTGMPDNQVRNAVLDMRADLFQQVPGLENQERDAALAMSLGAEETGTLVESMPRTA